MRKGIKMGLALCVLLLLAATAGTAEELREAVDLNGAWDFYADSILFSKLVQADQGALSARLPLEAQTHGVTLPLKVDCAKNGYLTKALVRIRAYASCDASAGALLGVRANGGEWVYTDISGYLNGQAHWIPAAVNTADLVRGDNVLEVCTTLRGKVYLMAEKTEAITRPGIRLHFCAPQAEWSTAQVPAAFETQLSNGARRLYPEEFDGVGYYRRQLTIPQTAEGENWFLQIGAADYRTEVFLNGRLLGSHEGGYTPFAVNLTAYPEIVRYGAENELILRVTDQTFGKSDESDSINIKETPAGFLQDTRGLNFGGVWGDVSLERRPAVYIEDVFFRPDVAKRQVTAVVTIRNTTGTPRAANLFLSIHTGEEATLTGVTVDAYGSAQAEVPVELKSMRLWSAEDPSLYTGRVILTAEDQIPDTFEDTFGMRSVDVEDGKIRLNGRNIFMTGALHWGMYWDIYTPACPVERVEEEIRQLKEAGFNTVKFCCVLPPDEVLDVYDRMGMYVYIEYPIWEPKETEAFFERCYLQMMEMVRKDRNHPCVIASDFSCELWSYSFEMEELLKWCVSQAKIEAPNRIYSDASSNGQHKFGDFATSHPYYQQNGFAKQVAFWTAARNASPDAPVKYSFYGLSRIKSSAQEKQPVVFGEFADTKVMRSIKELRQSVARDVTWYYDRFGLTDSAGILRRSGLSEERTAELLAASVKSAQEFKRAYIEASKRNSAMAGLFITHITDLQGGTAFGLLDDTGKLRYDAAYLREAAAEDALLLDTQTYNFWEGEEYAFGAEISHYGAAEIENAALTFTLCDSAGGVARRGTLLSNYALKQRDYAKLCRFQMTFPERGTTERYTLTLTLTQAGETLAQSSWNLWTYPRNTAKPADGVYVYDPDDLFGLTERYGWMYAYSGQMAKNMRLLITTQLDDQMLSWVKNGGRLIYLGAFGGPMSAAVNWNWDRSAMTYLPDEENGVVADLMAGGYGGLQFNDLLTNAQLTLPSDLTVTPIIGKFSYENAYLSAYIAVAKVGKGELMQSTLRHDEKERNLVSANELNFESMYRAEGENALGLHLLDNMISEMLRKP